MTTKSEVRFYKEGFVMIDVCKCDFLWMSINWEIKRVEDWSFSKYKLYRSCMKIV